MYHNLVKVNTSTTGTGSVTPGSAVTGFLSFADAGIATGEHLVFVLEDGNNREVSRGIYNGTTLSRDIVLASTNGGSKISLSGNATIGIVLAAEDVVNVDPAGRMMYMDDFISGSSETGEVGQLNWSFSTLTVSLNADTEQHPGVVRPFYTGTNSGAAMSLGAAQFSCSAIEELVFIVQPQYTAAATVNFRFGVADAGGIGSQTHGAFFERLAADTDWYGAVMNGSNKTRTANALLTDAQADDVWHKFKIRRISSTSWGFSVDDGTEEVISSGNYPDDADMVFPFFAHYNTSGTNSNSYLVDYFHARILPRTRF